MDGIKQEDLLKMLAGMSSGDEREESEDQESDEEDTEKHSRVKKACATVLMDMRREIHSLERALAVLNAKREALIEEHNLLVDEVKVLEEEPKPTDPFEETPSLEPERGVPSPGSLSEDERPGDDRPRETAPSELEPALDDMSRLERLQAGLDHAIEVLSGSKMAFHFKTLIQLRLDLTELSNADDKPEEERIAELVEGLKHAVEVLSTSPNAANSKTMRQLWGDLIVVLNPESEPKQ